MTSTNNRDEPSNNRDFQRRAQAISNRLQKLQDRMTELQGQVDEMAGGLTNAKTGTSPFFYQARDPTVLVGGIDTGWPSDYLEKLAVRLPAQVVESPSPLPPSLSVLVDQFQRKQGVAGVLKRAVATLCSEFYELQDRNGDLPAGKKYPQFHDQTVDGRWRDQWGD
jgi:hypothetical protein